MTESPTALAAAPIALGLAFISGASIFASPLNACNESPTTRHRHDVYEDEDGVASPASMHAFARQVRRATICIHLSCLLGLLFSVSSAILLGWPFIISITTVGWVLLNANGLFLARESSPTRKFAIGLCIASSAAVLASAHMFDVYVSWSGRSDQSHTVWTISLALRCAQLALALCSAIASACLPRRPAVWHDGAIVDAHYTCSALERYTFAWSRALLRHARKVSRLEYSDLPELECDMRSRVLLDRFAIKQSVGTLHSLWKAILRDHRAVFVRQWSLAAVESCFMMLPPLCLYKILTLLEHRDTIETSHGTDVWVWVVCLAISKLVHFGLDTWLQWVSFGCLATPVRSQLSALIFDKSLRLQSVGDQHGPAPANATVDGEIASLPLDEGEEAHETDTLLPREDGSKIESKDTGQDAEDRDGNAIGRGVVNLLSVDVERVSDFCGYNPDLLRGVVKIMLAAGFLIVLLGWTSALAGFAVPMLLEPLNRMATRQYTAKQLAVMSARDNKSHVVEEALHGIRQIKFSASEPQWETNLLAAREHELKAQREVYVWAVFLTFCWVAMPTMIGATALSVYAWMAQQMTASVAFTALAVFSSLEFTISALPTTITELLDARVSANRIQDHLTNDEREDFIEAGSSIEFRDADIAWPSHGAVGKGFRLDNLNLKFPSGELSVITGKTGTGKSLLLAAMIGEAELLRGSVAGPRLNNKAGIEDQSLLEGWLVPAAIAYVGQVPWLENASIRDAVLYGLPYNRQRFSQVLHACALHQDIATLPDGVRTEVGATGVNLSGGQRWRLTLARALYSRATVLILDDIFSAVDAHVGRHILENGITGDLAAGRTIILATHHVGLVDGLSRYVANLDHGEVTSSWREKISGARPSMTPMQRPGIPSAAGFDDTISEDSSEVHCQDAEAGKFVREETREHGRVKWNVYRMYIGASGGWHLWLVSMLIFTISAFAVIARSYWLAFWTETYTTEASKDAAREPTRERSLTFYLGVYIVISTFSVLIVSAKVTIVLAASLRAARHMFEKAAHNVLRAHMRWLDREPTGRILNRLVGDFAMIDSRLGGNFMWFLNEAFSVGAIILTALLVSLWMLIPVVILSTICLYVVHWYLDGARDLKRLESNAKSPIFEHVGSALSGLATIRSFGRADDYIAQMCKHIDRHTQTSWYILVTTQWMRFRLGALGVGFTLAVAAGVAYLPTISAAMAGFALSFALDFSSVAEETITRYTSVELAMNSSERALEYMQLDTEPTTGDCAPEGWPSSGRIKVTDLEVGYAPDLDSVLKGVTFDVQPGERVGIVGRTGSGKSSLTQSLFRFLEARKGTIEIDDINIARIRLDHLRGRLAIIPQDPVLFSGTVRSNLDPFNKYEDSTLTRALRQIAPRNAASSETVASTFDQPGNKASVFRNLHSAISRGGANLSQGEKQLLCLARAMIRRPKVLVLDEATSAVDMETDAVIQRGIREAFHDTTLLVIAHRLSTVADFDKILVMNDGRAVEFDTPGNLARRHGVFRQMLEDSGEEEALRHLLR